MKILTTKFINLKNVSFNITCSRCRVTFTFSGNDIVHKKFILKKSVFYKKNYVTCPYCGKKLKVTGYKFSKNNHDCLKE